MTNPLLHFKQNNLVNVKAVQAEHFAPAVTSLLADYTKVMMQVCALDEVSWEKLIAPLDQCHAKFNIAWNTISHIVNVLNSDDVRLAHEQLLPVVTDFFTAVMHNQVLFTQVKKLVNSPAFKKLNQTQQHILRLQLRDFELAGIALDQDKKAHYSKTLSELSKLTNKFSDHVLDVTDAWTLHLEENQHYRLHGLPRHSLQRASEKAAQEHKDGYIFTLDYPSYSAIMSYCDDRELRQHFYNAYCTRASAVSGPAFDNTLLIDQILALRQELARLVGFKNAAEYSLATKMAKDVELVLNFLYDVAKQAKQPALQQLQLLREFAKIQGLDGELLAHDIPYYAQKYQQLTFNIDQEQLRPYFPAPKVMRGMFDVAERLYNIQISDVTHEFVDELWHPLVNVYTVAEHGKLIGYFYADLYARAQKRGGAWMANLFDRVRYLDGSQQLPVVLLCCNFAPPIGSQPGLLTHEDVETAFHEFGHSLHGLLTKVDYLDASGMNGVPWDGVELPSQFFENWAWQFDVIQQISAHYLTGESLPEEKFNNLLQTKIYNSGLMILRQVEFALFDMLIHADLPENNGKSVQNVLDQVRQQVSLIKPPKLNKFQNSFTHIFDGGYAAGYYSYLWADVLSCDAFSYFARHGLYNAELGASFKKNILEKGGSDDFMALYKSYAGSEPDIRHLLAHYGLI